MIEYKPTGLIDRITLPICRVAMWGGMFIVAIIFFEVVSRYVFLSPTLWVNELSLWTAGMFYLFAGLYAMQQRSHIRILIVHCILPRWLRHCCDVLSLCLLFVFVFAVVWGGYDEAVSKLLNWERFGTAWNPPIPAIMKPLILLMLAAIFIQALSNLIFDWKNENIEHELDLEDSDPKNLDR
ncbi:TRAP transporter small permease [Candidatus Njordibacter sp. Uisw_056]|jgi:TRAP-type C4-dicarboxylate transport system permease small subunit|uniref:TRAP transporter small permease subunit n=1 Tax=Candidatus Njordibacter sp. Uisw_056 TaxID=3230973 RepID=UPI003D4C356A|tara:strand:+ start:2795 stop:3340 length:546 start_codon:yes stop_codon:yes gene_type:complete